MALKRLLILVACMAALCAFAPVALARSDDDGGWGDDDPGYGYGNDDGYGDEAPADSDDPAALPVPDLPAGTLKVAGTVARMRTNGRAAVPRGAPKRVQAIIAAANRIVGKPYKWGGGHAKLFDRGYDCSGTVSFALIGAGLLAYPLDSRGFMKWSSKGFGHWVSIYASDGHAYLEVAGLRLDTSAVNDPRGGEGPRWRPVIGKRPKFVVRHPAGL